MEKILILADMVPEQLARLVDAGYQPIKPASRAEIASLDSAGIRAVVTIGTIGLTRDEMAALPDLELILAMGVGYELVDMAAAAERGLIVTNGAGSNSETVADHAFALLLAVVRDIPISDRAARQGVWRGASLPTRPIIAGKRLGLVGYGAIGQALARRGEGFGMTIGYHARSARSVPHRYFADVLSLADWADCLIIAVPGGDETRHMITQPVLEALGPRGFLINVGRGSVIADQTLVAALAAGTIAGAGLDVYEDEPPVPSAYYGLSNVVLTPHLAGRSFESVEAMGDIVVRNLDAHFAGQPLINRVG